MYVYTPSYRDISSDELMIGLWDVPFKQPKYFLSSIPVLLQQLDRQVIRFRARSDQTNCARENVSQI